MQIKLSPIGMCKCPSLLKKNAFLRQQNARLHIKLSHLKEKMKKQSRPSLYLLAQDVVTLLDNSSS